MKGASERWRATGKALVKNRPNFAGQGRRRREIGPAGSGPATNGTSYPATSTFGRDGVVGEAYRHLVIAENSGCGLRMTHVGEDLPFVDGNPSASKDAGVFRLGDERADYGDASRMVRDGVVKEYLVILMTEEMMRPRNASGFRAGEVRRVRKDA